MIEKKKPTKKQQQVLNALKLSHHKKWVSLRELWLGINAGSDSSMVPNNLLPLRRMCLVLKDRGLVETKDNGKGFITDYRLTSACREVLRG
jgi:hypothetical protein